MESPVFFVKLLLIPSAIGAVVYLLFRRLKTNPVVFALVLALYYYFVRTSGVSFSVGLYYFLLSAFFSILGSWAHRNSTKPQKPHWLSSYQLVLTAALTSIMVGMYLAQFFPELTLFSFFLDFNNSGLNILVYPTLLVISPAVTPFLIWALQSMKLRPGMDKHLES